jgi:hypothetical protein
MSRAHSLRPDAWIPIGATNDLSAMTQWTAYIRLGGRLVFRRTSHTRCSRWPLRLPLPCRALPEGAWLNVAASPDLLCPSNEAKLFLLPLSPIFLLPPPARRHIILTLSPGV